MSQEAKDNFEGPESLFKDDEYEAPSIVSFTAEELMETFGPAQGYGGSSRPGPQTRGGLGRGHRLFPGIR